MPTAGEPAPDALVADQVGHSFGTTPVLRECSFTLPTGSVTALIGRNGAGKTTLLLALVGLLRPDSGTVRAFGQPVGGEVLPRIGFVAHHAPLYPMLTVAQTLRLGARLNPGWDPARARRLVAAATLPPAAKVGALSTGQRTRLAVAMALGKRPDLLVLDEPLANLDPVARTELTGTLMAEVAERGTTVLMSAHVVADIEEVCDHVVLLGAGRVRLAAGIESALSGHRTVVGPRRALAALAHRDVVELRQDGREFAAVVRATPAVTTTTSATTSGLTWHRPTLDELVLGYLRNDTPPPIEETTPA